MAKKTEKLGDTVDTLRPYLERALKDEEFRRDLRDALATARDIYGDLSKGNGGVKSATRFATDKDVQENLRKALEDLGSAAERIKTSPKKKKHKARNTVLLAGVVAGALYNPWTGAQTRQWLTDKLAGADDLQPLESWETPDVSSAVEAVEDAAAKATD